MPNQYLNETADQLKNACETRAVKTSVVSAYLDEYKTTISRPINPDIIAQLLACLYYPSQRKRAEITVLLEKNIIALIEECGTHIDTECWADYLHNAIENGYEKIVAAIIKKGIIDLTQPLVYKNTATTPLHIAIRHNQVAIMKLLIQHGVTITNKTNVLCFAAKNGFTRMAALLIALGADINGCDIDGRTPLDHAIENGRCNTVKLFIKNDSHVNTSQGLAKRTPLGIAVKYGQADIATLLIKNGAEVNVPPDCWSPLDTAIEYNRTHMMALLIAHGANIHEKDCFNVLPLVYAARYENPDIVTLLIENGASIDAHTKLSDAMKIFRLLSPSIGSDQNNIVRAIAEKLCVIADEISAYSHLSKQTTRSEPSLVTKKLNQLRPIIPADVNEELHKLLNMSLSQEDPTDQSTLTSPMKKVFYQAFYQKLIQFERNYIHRPLCTFNPVGWATLFSSKVTNTISPAVSQTPVLPSSLL